jgi:hypothetical protein
MTQQETPNDTPQDVVVVSGLPRSGTSMMMKMLEAGGMPVLVDHIRQPNTDNPRGYYEFERVKKLPQGDFAWLEDAAGKAVKIISQLVMHLPDTHTFRVIMMRRDIHEILASQTKMLEHRGETTGVLGNGQMAELFGKHLQKVYAWMDSQPNLTYLSVDYNRSLRDPLPVSQSVDEFLGHCLDVEQMASVIDPSLYRNRR